MTNDKRKFPCSCYSYPNTCIAVVGHMDANCIGCTLPAGENTKVSYGEMKAWEYHIAGLLSKEKHE